MKNNTIEPQSALTADPTPPADDKRVDLLALRTKLAAHPYHRVNQIAASAAAHLTELERLRRSLTTALEELPALEEGTYGALVAELLALQPSAEELEAVGLSYGGGRRAHHRGQRRHRRSDSETGLDVQGEDRYRGDRRGTGRGRRRTMPS